MSSPSSSTRADVARYNAILDNLLIPLTHTDITTQHLDPDCPICTEPLTAPVKLALCSHVFDNACIRTWLCPDNGSFKTTCPMCRRVVFPERAESPTDRQARERMVSERLRTRFRSWDLVSMYYADDQHPAMPITIGDVAPVVAALRDAHQQYDEEVGFLADVTEGDAWFVNNQAVALHVREAMVACVEALPVGLKLDIYEFESRLLEAGKQGFQPEVLELLEEDEGFGAFRYQAMQAVIFETVMQL